MLGYRGFGEVQSVVDSGSRGFGRRCPTAVALGKGVVEQTGASKGLQSVWAGCCENHSVGVFDLSHGTVMAAGYQTPKHNRRTDRGTITRAAWIKLWTQAEAAGKCARQLTGAHVSFGSSPAGASLAGS